MVAQQYPLGTQAKYNSFQSRIPVMKDGVKTGITERQGGVWKPEGFPMKGSGIRFADSDDRGVPPMVAENTPEFYVNHLLVVFLDSMQDNPVREICQVFEP